MVTIKERKLPWGNLKKRSGRRGYKTPKDPGKRLGRRKAQAQAQGKTGKI